MGNFNIYEDVAANEWSRYYYNVKAETLEEAIERVKNEKEEAYMYKRLYCVPSEIHSNANREIYYNDELVWDNSTPIDTASIDSLHNYANNVSNVLYKIFEEEPDEYILNSIPYIVLKETLKKLDWSGIDFTVDSGANMQEYFINLKKDYKYVINGNLYFGTFDIQKEHCNE